MRFTTTVIFPATAVTLAVMTTTTDAFVVRPQQHVPSHATTALPVVASFDPLEVDNALTDYNNKNKNDRDPEKDKNHNSDMVTQLPLLALQLVAVLGIKAVKDVVHYPPLWIDEVLVMQQGNRQAATSTTTADDILNPPMLALKFVALLLFKTAHDAIYYPTVWTQRWWTCQSLDECPLPE